MAPLGRAKAAAAGFAALLTLHSAQAVPPYCHPYDTSGLISIFTWVAAYADVFVGAPLGVLSIFGMIFGAIGVSYAVLYPHGQCCCYLGTSPGRCRHCCPSCAGSCCDGCTSDILLANKVLLALQTPSVAFGVVCLVGGAIEQIICRAGDPIWAAAVFPWLALMGSGWATSLAAVVKLRRAYRMHGPPKPAPVVDPGMSQVTNKELTEVLSAPTVSEGMTDTNVGSYQRLGDRV